ncbi:S-methyl-5-thioribose-1-phosphate isomerase [Clydaea vesicula]|uniref:Methylthioribose-1-phosphate isomerase n=1 Tax=Clydaea vesicula TaxID=447962 RepID=A0AAD5U0R9_9FUNG|nr:S-methyl-5-thioribose-1-phosphate isomerase [Clydaea vesicula]KAJ3387643.1 S-methyl-5-thioribose-1-phosphate isomerase [Lobulomyces angularis]
MGGIVQSETLLAIKYSRGSLEILNQLLLPFQPVYDKITTVDDGHDAIRTMRVRGGAPAIAVVASLSLAIELNVKSFVNKAELNQFVKEKLSYLKTSRPTAVDLFNTIGKLLSLSENFLNDTVLNVEKSKLKLIEFCEAMLQTDVENNKNIGSFGSEFLKNYYKSSSLSEGLTILTHCNTGSLATAGWGTALGIIRSLNEAKNLSHVYCTETRPYNQGGRLTAYELVYEKIPSTLICDSMASALLKTKNVNAIIVGADRVCANGDTANKIGTYQLAITAKYHGIPFLVAAPSTSIDFSLENGSLIPIEVRNGSEVSKIKGLDEGDGKLRTLKISADGINIWNPGFDVTPADLISAIVTEKGVFEKLKDKNVFNLKKEYF